MKILVTGSAGFIGKHVCDLLFQHGHTVQGVDAFLRQVHGLYDKRKVRQWEWCTTVGNVAQSWGGSEWDTYDAVIHLAAEVGVAQSMYEPARYVNANTLDTIKLWERVVKHKNIKRFVQASSMSIYGEGAYYTEGAAEYKSGLVRNMAYGFDGFDEQRCGGQRKTVGRLIPMPTDETKTPEPASVYARTKLDQEQYSLLMGETYRVPTIALRFFGTYGEGQSLLNPYTGVAAIFACRVLNGKPPLVFEDGQQRRDFIHVSDVARAVVSAVEASDVTGVFNVGTGIATTVGDMAQVWCDIASKRGFPHVAPKILNRFRAGDIRHAYADITKIGPALSWAPQVQIGEGLDRLADWIIANKFHEKVPQDNTETAIVELERAGLVK